MLYDHKMAARVKAATKIRLLTEYLSFIFCFHIVSTDYIKL